MKKIKSKRCCEPKSCELTGEVCYGGSSVLAVAERDRQPIGLTDTSEGSGDIAFTTLHTAVAIRSILEGKGRQSNQ